MLPRSIKQAAVARNPHLKVLKCVQVLIINHKKIQTGRRNSANTSLAWTHAHNELDEGQRAAETPRCHCHRRYIKYSAKIVENLNPKPYTLNPGRYIKHSANIVENLNPTP